jgi:hypothetical protein
MTSRRLQIVSILAAGLLMAAGFGSLRHLPGLGITALSALIWFFAILREKSWAVQIGFVLNFSAAAYSIIAGANPVYSLGVVLFSLAGWDLSRFAPVVGRIVPSAAALRTETLHLRRLGLTLGLGAVSGLAAILIRFQLSFTAAIILGLLAIFALALSAIELGRTEEDSVENDAV